MELMDQLIPIDFGMGIDQSADKKQVMPGKMSQLQNVRLTKAKQLSKRYGYARVGTLAAPMRAAALDALDERPYGIQTGGQISAPTNASYLGGASVNLGPQNVACSMVVNRPGGGGADDQSQVDSATIGSCTLYVWVSSSSGKAYYMPVDETSNQQMQPAQEIASGSLKLRVRVLAVNGVFLIGLQNTTANQLAFYVFDPASTTTLGAAASTIGLTAGGKPWDWAAYDTYALVAVHSAASTITVARISSAGTSLGSTTFATTAAVTSAIGVCAPITGTSSVGRILFADAANGMFVRYFNSQTLAAGPFGGSNTLIDATLGGGNDEIGAIEFGSGFVCTRMIFAALTYNNSTQFLRATDGAPPTVVFTNTVRTVTPISRPFLIPTNVNCVCFLARYISPNNLQNTYFLILQDCLSSPTLPAKPVAKLFSGAGLPLISATGIPASANSLGSNRIGIAVPYVSNAKIANGSIIGGFSLAAAVFDFTVDGTSFRSATLAESKLISGGMLAQFDGGGGIVEHGFMLFPEGVTLATGAGGSLSAGTYQYIVVWEWTDERGKLHRSGPSIAVSVTATAGQKCDVTIPCLRMTLKDVAYTDTKRASIRLGVYRTEANGTTFYRISGPAGGRAMTLNTMLTASVVFSDTAMTDAALISNEVLYTVGGELRNFTPDGSSACAQSEDRIFVADATDDSTIWPSKPLAQAAGIAWAQEVRMQVPADDGPVTAIAVQNSNILVFKRNTAYAASGDGPDATGQFGAFSSFELIPSASGCRRQGCCVTTPLGTLVYAYNGFHLIGNDLSWTYVGKAVKDFESQDCTSMEHVPTQKQVRCNMSGGAQLIFNYEYPDAENLGQWFTSSFNALDGVFTFDGKYYAINGDGALSGIVYNEDSTRFTDQALGAAGADRNISMLLETAWIDIATKNGFQRLRAIYLLGEFISAHNLTIQIAYDHSDTYEAAAWTFSGATVTAGGVAYRVKIQPRIQKCTSFRLKITDDGAGAACTLTTMTAAIAVKKGGAKLRAQNTV